MMEEEVKRLFGLDIVSILSDDQLDFTNAKQCTISLGEKMKIKLDILVHGTVDEKQSCYFFLIIECKRSNCQRAVKQLAVHEGASKTNADGKPVYGFGCTGTHFNFIIYYPAVDKLILLESNRFLFREMKKYKAD